MSEKLNPKIEIGNQSPEQSSPRHENKHERHEKQPEHSEKLSDKERQEQLSALRNEVSRESQAQKETAPSSSSERDHTPQGPINKELKNMMRIRTLTRIRKELSAPNKTLSKVIHSKPVEKVSEVCERTVARPIGLIGGSLIALAGSLAVFYMAKHYGFRYNLLFFFMLFVGGYILTTIVELILKLAKKSKN